MGLRVVGLRLDNCRTRGYTVDGYPLLELLDDGLEPVDGVEILDGSREITAGAGADKQPRPVTLRPGESATAGLVWCNTTELGTPVNVPYVRVRAKASADPVTVTPNHGPQNIATLRSTVMNFLYRRGTSVADARRAIALAPHTAPLDLFDIPCDLHVHT
ncbi:DUF4232 domain-containing protein [Streptomyces sp. NPDC059814]|uniref:DUF4232 domain-containing protein n=1 Tax=Streptomyces sp. NPDC059814 TaxID=3346959 RepID=UPI0036609CAE